MQHSWITICTTQVSRGGAGRQQAQVRSCISHIARAALAARLVLWQKWTRPCKQGRTSCCGVMAQQSVPRVWGSEMVPRWAGSCTV